MRFPGSVSKLLDGDWGAGPGERGATSYLMTGEGDRCVWDMHMTLLVGRCWAAIGNSKDDLDEGVLLV